MATAGPNAPTGAISHASLPSGSTVVWNNPGAATGAQDNNAAGATGLSASKISRYLVLTDLGFALPSNATVLGVTVTIRRKATVTTTLKDYDVKLVKAGTVTGTNKANTHNQPVNWDTSYRNTVYGGASDLWGATLAYSDVNDTSFGFAIAVTNASATGSTAAIDNATVEVEYTTSSATGATSSTSATFAVIGPTVGSGTGTGGTPVTGVFVSPSGNDTTGNGTQASPYRKVRKALQVAQAGAVIYMRGGTHGAQDLRDISRSALTKVTPYPGETATVGPIRFDNSANIRFEGDAAAGNMVLKATASDTVAGVYSHAWWVTGASHHVEAAGFKVTGTDTPNCFWLAATGGHDFKVEDCICGDSAWISSIYGTQADASAGVALVVVAPAGNATYNVWIQRNFAYWLEGWDFVQISGGSTSPTNRHRNIWIQDNETDHVFQGRAIKAHSDGTQVIGYSGPNRRGLPNDPEQPDYNATLPVDVGVVIRRNKYHAGGRILIMPQGSGTGTVPTAGEHDSIIVDSNLIYDPRGAADPGPVPDVARYDFAVKLYGNCPNFRVMYNSLLSYPLTGTSTGGNQGLIIGGKSGDAAATDQGSVNGVLVGNITDYLNIINSGGTVVSYRSGGVGWNTYRATSGTYVKTSTDVQGTVTFRDPANGDFSVPSPNPNAYKTGGSTWIPLLDEAQARRPRTNPTRGALEASAVTVENPRPNPTTYVMAVIPPTVGGGTGAVTARPSSPADVTWNVLAPTVGAGTPEPNTSAGFQALVIDPGDEPFTMMRNNPGVNQGVSQVRLTSHKFTPPSWARVEASSLETEGAVPVTQHTENSTIQVTFDVIEQTAEDLRAKMNAIEAKIAKLGTGRDRTGKTGEIAWTLPSGQAVTWDVIGVDAYDLDVGTNPGDVKFYSANIAQVSLTLACRPYGIGDERLIGSWSETAQSLLVAKLENVPGHVPAIGRLAINPQINSSFITSDARSVTWGIESENYDPANSSPLVYPLWSGFQYQGGTVSDSSTAYGQAYRFTMPLSGTSYALVSPRATPSSDVRLNHVGRYRVFARAKTPHSGVEIAAEWWPSFRGDSISTVGSTSVGAYGNQWAGFANVNAWELLDLGFVEARGDLSGGWALTIRGRGESSSSQINLDSVMLIPTDYWGRFIDRFGWEYQVDHQGALVQFAQTGGQGTAVPKSYEGDYLRVPTGTSRLAVNTSTSQMVPDADGGGVLYDQPILDVSVDLWIRPRWLTFPDEFIDPFASTIRALA